MRTVEDLRAELEEVPEQQAQLDLPGLMTRGRRARLRRRAVVGTAGVAVIAIAATPMVWFGARGPASEGQPPVLGRPSATASEPDVPNVPKATATKPTAPPAGDGCSVYWVCKNKGDKPVAKPLAGKVVRVGATVGSSPVVLFATKDKSVYAGYLPAGAGKKPVPSNILFQHDAVTASLEPLPMYRAENGTDWAVVGQLKGTTTSVSAVFANGSRRPAKLTADVLSGYTHFWLGGAGAMPVKFEAKTSHGTVSCTLDKCSSIG